MAIDVREAPELQRPRAARHGERTRRKLRLVAEILVELGVVLLLFVAYEYFGTSYLAARAQAHLRDHVSAHGFANYALPSEPSTVGSEKRRAVPGGALGFIKIPRINLDMVFVEGADEESLRKGPGHYRETPLPGQGGNVAIAGHRTTYLHPFWSLNEVRVGDLITLETKKGVFVYRVIWQRIVSPEDRWIVGATGEPSLTLTACHPRFSAAQRLVVRAVQTSGPGLGQAAAPVT